MPVDVNRPGIAVICNAWQELVGDIHETCFAVSARCCDIYPGIEYILLASTHVSLDATNQGPNLWFDNSKRVFVDEQGVDWVRRLWYHAIIETEQKTFANHRPNVRDHDYRHRECIAIWEQWQLEWLLNHYFSHVENIWYFGAGLGVRRDPFGWGHLCDSIKHKHIKPVNILTHRLGILNNLQNGDGFQSDFDFVDWDALSGWQMIDNDLVVKTDLDWQ